MVVSTLKAAGKRTGKIISNLHTGQYTGSISPGHSQGQTLVEPLALPGVTRHLKFLRRTTQKRLAIHTHWCRRRGCRGCKRTPKSFDLLKIWAKSLKIWAKSLKIWAKTGQNPQISRQNLWKSEQKWRPTLFDFKYGAQRLQKNK